MAPKTFYDDEMLAPEPINVGKITFAQTQIESSGEKRIFDTGARRDSNIKELKGRMDLIPAIAIIKFAKFLGKSDIKYTTEKEYYYDEALGSLYQWLFGYREDSHWLCNALWGAMQLLHMDSTKDVLPFTSISVKENLDYRFDMISPYFLQRVSIHYQKGGINYGDRNWENGMPCMVLWDCAARHLWKWLEGKNKEDHLAAISWNIMSLIHTIEMIKLGKLPKSLDDIPPVYFR